MTFADGHVTQAGDAVLAMDDNRYDLERATVTHTDGSRATTISGRDAAGVIRFVETVDVSADGRETLRRFDDDGDGSVDRSQTIALSDGANGADVRLVENFGANLSRRRIAARTALCYLGEHGGKTGSRRSGRMSMKNHRAGPEPVGGRRAKASRAVVHAATGFKPEATDRLMKAAGAKGIGGNYAL